jgi:hypothetical protein
MCECMHQRHQTAIQSLASDGERTDANGTAQPFGADAIVTHSNAGFVFIIIFIIILVIFQPLGRKRR